MQELMLTRDEVAARLGVAPSAVAGLVKRSACPLAPGRQVEGQRRWPQSEVIAAESWLTAQAEPAVRRAEAPATRRASAKSAADSTSKSKASKKGKASARADDAPAQPAKAKKRSRAKAADTESAQSIIVKPSKKKAKAVEAKAVEPKPIAVKRSAPAQAKTKAARPKRPAIVETPSSPAGEPQGRALWSEAAPGPVTPPIAAALPPMMIAPMQAMVKQMTVAVRETSRRQAFGPMTEWMLLGPVIMLNALRAPLDAATASAPEATEPALAATNPNREAQALYAAGRVAS